MPIEVHETAFTAPYRCSITGCAEPGPYVLVNGLLDENGMQVWISRQAVQEMADALGLTKEVRIEENVIVRDPTPEEIERIIIERFRVVPKGASLNTDQETAYTAQPTAEVCICGREFTGPTAKANLANHKRTCSEAKAHAAD